MQPVDSEYTQTRIAAADVRAELKRISLSPEFARRPQLQTVHSSATPELLDLLAKQGIPWDVFKSARKPVSEAHNRQETPFFVKSIERHALRNSTPAGIEGASKVALGDFSHTSEI